VAQKFSADAAELGTSVTGVTTSLMETLGGITGKATAESALPKLKDASNRLDEIRARWDTLPDAAKATITAMVSTQLGKLKRMIDSILALPGVGTLLEPILDDIVEKLSAFGE
jgi:hypothetical protein